MMREIGYALQKHHQNILEKLDRLTLGKSVGKGDLSPYFFIDLS